MQRGGFPIKVEYLCLKQVREQRRDITDIVTWLLHSHIHFIITHIHQGMETAGGSVQHIYNECARLKYHPGFPSGVQLQCPIFSQDKWKYLQDIPATMRTCKVSLAEGSEEDTESVAAVWR